MCPRNIFGLLEFRIAISSQDMDGHSLAGTVSQ